MNTISKQIIEILSKNDIDEKNYLNSLTDSYIVYKISRYDIKGKEYAEKCYKEKR